MGCQSITGLALELLSSPTWVERGTVRFKSLAQEHNAMSQARARTWTLWSGDERTNHEDTAPANKTYCQKIWVTISLPTLPLRPTPKLNHCKLLPPYVEESLLKSLFTFSLTGVQLCIEKEYCKVLTNLYMSTVFVNISMVFHYSNLLLLWLDLKNWSTFFPFWSVSL